MVLFKFALKTTFYGKLWFSSASSKDKMVRILNVAEKNDAAKSIADLMSRGHYRRRDGISKFNKIYEFEYNILGGQHTMTMTSVSGHLLNFEFTGQYRNWQGCSPVALFDAPVEKQCLENYTPIKRSLEKEVRGCQTLIIWTDGDREGENIGFEIIQVCRAIKPNIRVYRARFSEITPQAIQRACNNLLEPDQNTSDAVDVRSELDLRIGAAFTRLQTMRLQKRFPQVLSQMLISYGSCQFPTLGFVVERYKQVQNFVPEPFWKIKVTSKTEGRLADFTWDRNRLFDQEACYVLLCHCLENPVAKVTEVIKKPKSKWRPQPLDTVELEKLASRKLRINAKETMRIAEKLYTQGYISYPRTETNQFPKDMDLRPLIQAQTADPNWGGFADRVLTDGPNPRNGNKTDNAHPPIHPLKYTNNLQGNEARVYEFIIRHFLATCAKDAQGAETKIVINIQDEIFKCSGLSILARNYLEVYPYDNWSDKVIPTFEQGETFEPSSIEMVEGETMPPKLLTEADLIALMEKHGIGTDATHADHIERIKDRRYVGLQPDGRFVPGELGMGLVEGYDAMGFEMSKPHLRRELEADLKRICEGRKNKDVVLQEQVSKYRDVFIEASQQVEKIDEALSRYFGQAVQIQPQDINFEPLTPLRKCSCGSDLVIKKKKDGNGLYVTCMGFPDCKTSVWFPNGVIEAKVDEALCPRCQEPTHLVALKFKRGSVPPSLGNEYTGCVLCDDYLIESLDLKKLSNQPRNNAGRTAPLRQANRPQGQNNQPQGQNNWHQGPNNQTWGQNDWPQGQNNYQPRGQNNQPRGKNRGRGFNKFPKPRQPSSRKPRQANTKWQKRPAAAVTGNVNRTMGGDQGNNQQDIECSCGENAALLSVRKEGHNKGRKFYACKKPQGTGCDFFQWADQLPPQNNPTTYTHHQPGGPSNSSGSGIKCNCGENAKLLTVCKDGQNKGRPFHSCSKPRDEGCGFFAWADVDENRGEDLWLSTGPNRQRGNGNAPKKRKCGLCKQEGHTKKTCPQNN